jgi:hypothetical protein
MFYAILFAAFRSSAFIEDWLFGNLNNTATIKCGMQACSLDIQLTFEENV